MVRETVRGSRVGKTNTPKHACNLVQAWELINAVLEHNHNRWESLVHEKEGAHRQKEDVTCEGTPFIILGQLVLQGIS